ncbi:hypothetical protein [Streptomyces sp. NPDC093514]|uniref:hypothetical protein n=1 Tax=Streptomyces sp. NPDC093514 TaxID=3366039 RepID=UPI003803FA21
MHAADTEVVGERDGIGQELADLAGREQAEPESDFLIGERSRAVGLGDRDRHADTPARLTGATSPPSSSPCGSGGRRQR